MKLSEAKERSLVESTFIEPLPILEDGEAPRWRFLYDKWRHDPRPDILLLGSFRHPSTGNNLVGGINLHYLDQEQVDDLARSLPVIMRGNSLYARYREGRRALPEIFNNFYRTYNASFIRGVTRDIMYPKYGFVKTAKNWLSKTLGGMFKKPEQRAKEAEPKYPEDLGLMNQRLDQVVRQLQERPPEEAADEPEMQAARDEYIKATTPQTELDTIRKENIPLNRASQDYAERQDPSKQQERAPATTDKPSAPKDAKIASKPAQTTAPMPSPPYQITKPPTRPTAPSSVTPVAPLTARPEDIELMGSQATEAPEETVPELTDISDNNKRTEEEVAEESIIYYSPIKKRYIIESLCKSR